MLTLRFILASKSSHSTVPAYLHTGYQAQYYVRLRTGVIRKNRLSIQLLANIYTLVREQTDAQLQCALVSDQVSREKHGLLQEAVGSTPWAGGKKPGQASALSQLPQGCSGGHGDSLGTGPQHKRPAVQPQKITILSLFISFLW